ncbi:MAG: hypothetical protein AAFS01_11645 [Pseudomonadota bacterium]
MSGKTMSDPMTNTDVEDVLASIRRLVSDNGRPGSASVQQPPSDRLVLTPSLRVPEGEDADEAGFEDEIGADEEIADAFDDQDGADDLQGKDDDALSTFAQTAFRTSRPAPDRMNVRENGFMPADDSAVVAKLSADLSARDVSDAAIPAQEALPSDPMTVPDETTDAGEATATSYPEDEAPSAEASESSIVPEDWESEVDHLDAPHGDHEREEMGEPGEPLVAEPHDADGLADDEHSMSAIDVEVEDLPEDPLTPVEKSLSEKIAALETLVGARRDQFEPDDPGTDAYAGTEPPAMEWEDTEPDAEAAPAEMSGELADDAAQPGAIDDIVQQAAQDAVEDVIAGQVQPAQDLPEPDVSQNIQSDAEDAEEKGLSTPYHAAQDATRAMLFGSSEDDILDEDALRELISDIVREELQGALGERITRNVRKLVRREIHRALAAQDLE